MLFSHLRGSARSAWLAIDVVVSLEFFWLFFLNFSKAQQSEECPSCQGWQRALLPPNSDFSPTYVEACVPLKTLRFLKQQHPHCSFFTDPFTVHDCVHAFGHGKAIAVHSLSNAQISPPRRHIELSGS